MLEQRLSFLRQVQNKSRRQGVEMDVIVEPDTVHKSYHLNKLLLGEPEQVPGVEVGEGLDVLAVSVVSQPALGGLHTGRVREEELPGLVV